MQTDICLRLFSADWFGTVRDWKGPNCTSPGWVKWMLLVYPYSCDRPWANNSLALCWATRGRPPVELGGEHRSAICENRSQHSRVLEACSFAASGLRKGGVWYKPSSPQHRRSLSCRKRQPWVPWAHSTAGWNHRTSHHDNNRQW